ncbi:MAG: dephospho-CoA kinase [Spirochaetaceae bacterium]|jgi:dephospho-CoA kinase|nr:dephospho-CoA kinase [Spirochaetaceae bacterium]
MILGIAGKTGCGKNLLAQSLEARGFVHFDLDLWAHDALEGCLDAIIGEFGNAVIDSRGNINRKAIGLLVFKNPSKRQKLQDIIYPWLEKNILEELAKCDKAILNGALLSESNLAEKCDLIFWIKSPWILRLIRIWKRDKIKLSAIFQRFRAQRFLKPQLFSSKVDIHIVYNRLNPQKFIKTAESKVFN